MPIKWLCLFNIPDIAILIIESKWRLNESTKLIYLSQTITWQITVNLIVTVSLAHLNMLQYSIVIKVMGNWCMHIFIRLFSMITRINPSVIVCIISNINSKKMIKFV